jgi:N utilization substance protein B
MLNRRHIRLKIMQLIYALKISDFNYDSSTEKQLFKSLEDIYDLYLILISILIEIQIKAESYLKLTQQKHLATSDDKNPSKKFINNRIYFN